MDLFYPYLTHTNNLVIEVIIGFLLFLSGTLKIRFTPSNSNQQLCQFALIVSSMLLNSVVQAVIQVLKAISFKLLYQVGVGCMLEAL